MSAQNQKNSIKKLVSVLSVATASVFLGFPALAFINSNSSSFDSSLNNRTRSVEATGRSRQLLAQMTPVPGGTGTGGTGTGTGQTGTGGTGTGQTGTGGTGTGQTGTGGTGTGQTGTGGTGTGGTGTGQTGTGGTGTGQTDTGGTGTGQTDTGGTNSNNGQTTGRQDAFTQYMLAGYAATQQRDYQTALTNFQGALRLRPNNPYAIRAVNNVRGYLQRDAQSGTANTTRTNQTGTNTTQNNQQSR